MSHCRKSMWHGVGPAVASKRNSGGVRRCQVQSLLSMLGVILVWAVSKNICCRKAPVTAPPCQRATLSFDFSPRLKSLGKIHLSLFHPLFLIFKK